MMRSEADEGVKNGTTKPYSNGALAESRKTANASSNGFHKSHSMNGSLPLSRPNGLDNNETRPTYFGHDREEVTRILLQALSDLGYKGSTGMLSQESGYSLENTSVTAFRVAVCQGEWTEAEALLFGDRMSQGTHESHNRGLTLAEGADKNLMRFWLRQQKYLELLEERDTGRALTVLRTELTPLYKDTGKLHFLSSLIMCQSADDLKTKAGWDGAYGQSRQVLLSNLARLISPAVMIPEHRLAILLQQVKDSQIWNCLYHSTEGSPSLYCDHKCDRSNFPLTVVRELDKHTGQVWHIRYSNDGSKLASCGQDGTTIVYDTGRYETLQILTGHKEGVTSIAWSPDDSMLITCSLDKTARLWNSKTGEQIRIISHFEEPPTCAWLPDGQTFITGSLYIHRNLCQWSIKGDLVFDWGRNHRIQDLAISPDGARLVAMGADNHIHVYNLKTRELEYELDLKIRLCSVTISKDSLLLLVSRSDGEARIFNLETRESIKAFNGPKGGPDVFRSDFGGANESVITSGSHDGTVFIWHVNGTLIDKLEGHPPGVCIGVSWNPRNPRMFATAGDDAKVRIWGNETSPKAQLPEPMVKRDELLQESSSWISASR